MTKESTRTVLVMILEVVDRVEACKTYETRLCEDCWTRLFIKDIAQISDLKLFRQSKKSRQEEYWEAHSAKCL